MRKRNVPGILAKRLAGALGVCALIFGGSSCLMVQAAPAEVYDEADLLSDDEEEQLSLQIQKLSDTYDMNFVVLTIDDAEGKTATEYADDFYIDKGYTVNDRKGGAIYLVDMDNREVRVEANQDMQYYLTDKRADEVIDAGYDDVKNGDYYDCFENMLDQTVQFLDAGVPAGQYTYDEDTGEYEVYHSLTVSEVLIALGIAIVAGAAVCVTVNSTYKTQFTKYHYPWQKNAKFHVKRKDDHLINHYVTSREIPKDPPSGSGGDDNVTTTHTSSSGDSFSGSGRSF